MKIFWNENVWKQLQFFNESIHNAHDSRCWIQCKLVFFLLLHLFIYPRVANQSNDFFKRTNKCILQYSCALNWCNMKWRCGWVQSFAQMNLICVIVHVTTWISRLLLHSVVHWIAPSHYILPFVRFANFNSHIFRTLYRKMRNLSGLNAVKSSKCMHIIAFLLFKMVVWNEDDAIHGIQCVFVHTGRANCVHETHPSSA